ncbi:MAG: DUF357 domain-containing protein [Halodesulfurarchaeum sp.]
MPADLGEKVKRYEGLLAEAIEAAEPVPDPNTPLGDAATDFMTMASSYLDDGRHFDEEGDQVNALAAYAYGHAWLDAGARLGLFSVPSEGDLFTV